MAPELDSSAQQEDVEMEDPSIADEAKDQALKEKNQAIKERDEALVRLDQANKEIRRLTAVLACANEDHRATIEDLEGQVASLESRIEEVDAKRREMRTELSGTKTDIASVIKNLKQPWTSFLAIYNEMCLPVDEQLNDKSLKVLLEKVLDAKLKQVIAKAAKEEQGEPDEDDGDHAIMLQLPIKQLEALSLTNDDQQGSGAAESEQNQGDD
ncbi:hypothetical protein F4778DRAFT_780611 [Xylariomycetidae sp. FL2044]|nr:hypothetical protein F4778DRAFT_780611 [Xylariomycetidae sp. FL2044]